MGATYSTSQGGAAMLQRPGYLTQRRCLAKDKTPWVDDRGWALTQIYGVPARLLDMYPPKVYSLDQARQDIQACQQGRDLPHRLRVVRFDRMAGSKDLRVYALTKLHGFTARELRDRRVLQQLPYSTKDAQIDVTYHARHGKPFYVVDKWPALAVRTSNGRILRTALDKGYRNDYKYNPYDPRASVGSVTDFVKRKVDLSKYPPVVVGGRLVHKVPCAAMPRGFCGPSDQVYTVIAEAGAVQAAGGPAAAVQRTKRQLTGEKLLLQRHAAQMGNIKKRMAGLRQGSPQFAKLAANRQALRAALRRQLRANGHDARTTNAALTAAEAAGAAAIARNPSSARPFVAPAQRRTKLPLRQTAAVPGGSTSTFYGMPWVPRNVANRFFGAAAKPALSNARPSAPSMPVTPGASRGTLSRTTSTASSAGSSRRR